MWNRKIKEAIIISKTNQNLMTSTSATDFLQKKRPATQRVKQPCKGKHYGGFILHAVIFNPPELTVSSLGH